MSYPARGRLAHEYFRPRSRSTGAPDPGALVPSLAEARVAGSNKLGLILALLTVAAPAQAASLDPHASFLDQGAVALPARSQILDSIDKVDGCGPTPPGGR